MELPGHLHKGSTLSCVLGLSDPPLNITHNNFNPMIHISHVCGSGSGGREHRLVRCTFVRRWSIWWVGHKMAKYWWWLVTVVAVFL